ncbi:hypothetical protein H7J86_24380 [Mycobacterium hackensackense]|uniref:hypothetical protein n=1 Tax=Mycobacterium hackensackense TaxID=228909 RepID=UPI0022659BD0|nr:hypothetical protein [Mycobacterium hackensackense]MCV7255305.1 hypothetical protein [Mycobacterium hackensackense]
MSLAPQSGPTEVECQPARPSLRQLVTETFELPQNAIAPRVGAALLLVVHASLFVYAVYGLATGTWGWYTPPALIGNGLMVWWRTWQLLHARRQRAAVSRPVDFWPARDFIALCECRNCSEISTHGIREPKPGKDPAEATVIRQCAACGQEWAER